MPRGKKAEQETNLGEAPGVFEDKNPDLMKQTPGNKEILTAIATLQVELARMKSEICNKIDEKIAVK